jgi:glycosyltransferase involved in cell wall biosynthesis
MACGRPVVSYDCNYGPSELITDQVSGRLVRVGDKQALANAMSAILSDEAAASRMSLAARAAMQHYSLRRVANCWVSR